MFLRYKGAAGAGLIVIASLSMGAVHAQTQELQPQAEEANAAAQHGHHHFLNGQYGLVTFVSCAYSDPQAPGVPSIEPTTGQFLDNGEPINLSGQGIMTFEPNGKLKLDAIGAQVETNKTLAGETPFLSGFDSLCDGSYTISGSGKQISLTFNCGITATGLGVKLNVGPLKWDGYIGPNAEQIHLNGEQNVQNIGIAQISTGKVVQQQQRICLQVSSLDKL